MILKIKGPHVSAYLPEIVGNSTYDAENYVDQVYSDFLWLKPGDNDLEYSSLDDTLSTVVEIYFHDWYLGVG